LNMLQARHAVHCNTGSHGLEQFGMCIIPHQRSPACHFLQWLPGRDRLGGTRNMQDNLRLRQHAVQHACVAVQHACVAVHHAWRAVQDEQLAVPPPRVATQADAFV
jgi:hypothetical protein